MSQTPTIIPCLRYRDAAAAIAFLKDAFGFAEHAVYAGEGGRIEHAELSFGNGMVMLGSTKADDPDWRTVAEAGGYTQTNYLVVNDVDAHCTRARAAGARITQEPRDESYGGRGYAARDPEDHLWYFGSYRPHTPAE
ncbi:VOC family protein [Muricoccus radiodurans]|uniref:VOC family protein n=1 Tax=Muricoccus radiodurans TaxID=2231721 RepID=UPI003CEB5490